MDPPTAIVSVYHPTFGGIQIAEQFGWKSPHPEPDFGAKERAEEMTTAAAIVPIYLTAPTPAEGAFYVDPVETAYALVEP